MTVHVETALSLAARIRSRELTAREATEQAIARIDAVNPKLNAVIWRNDEQALAQAEMLDARLAGARASGESLPAFLGVPIPIKDLASVAGQPNTLSSRAVSETPRGESDLSVQALLDAGFVLLGRTNSPEMGPMTVSENQRWGVTRNPWNPAFTPGGSSGGAAACVASGMFAVAHASDGGGSIRVPSSCCGTVGLKPSRGRVPTKITSWEASSTDGVITQTVADSAAILDALSTPNPHLYYPSAPAPDAPFLGAVGAQGPRLRVGLLLDAPTGLPVDPECVAAAVGAAQILVALGHDVFPATPIFHSPEAIEGFIDVIINASLHAYPIEDESLTEPYIQRRLARARDFHAGDYAKAAARLHDETPRIRQQWGRDFDLLLTPTMATQTPPVGEVLAEANTSWDGGRETEIRMISFTAVSNISGLPAISLPVHTSSSGMPVGVQLVGGPFGEWELLRVAAEIEQVSGWVDRRPGIHA